MKKEKMTHCKNLLFAMILILCSIGSTYEQNGHTVSGIIKDANGEPLIGVSVLEAKTTNGSITYINGKYTLKLTTAKPVLSISYIGYMKQDVPVGNRKEMNIVLKEESVGLEALRCISSTAFRKTT